MSRRCFQLAFGQSIQIFQVFINEYMMLSFKDTF